MNIKFKLYKCKVIIGGIIMLLVGPIGGGQQKSNDMNDNSFNGDNVGIGKVNLIAVANN